MRRHFEGKGPKNYIIKISHRPRGNADKMTIVSYDEKGKRTVREERIEPKAPEEGYYNGKQPYKMTSKDEAEKLSHKDANLVRGKLKRLGYSAIIENAV